MSAATATAGDATESAEASEPKPLPWGLAHRRYNTVSGATGGVHLVDPSSGAPGSVRLQIVLDSYSGSDFLLDGDSVEQQGQAISLSWTPTEYLELYGSLQNRGTATTEPETRSLHVLGDMVVGLELFTNPVKLLRLGGGLRFGLVNAMGTSDTVLNATSVGIRGTAALDLQQLSDPVPFITRLNLDYVFDNSNNVIDDLEETRFENLDAPADEEDEVRHLVDRFERFALGVGRVDMFNIGLGFEFPIELGERVYLHPVAEGQVGIPVNRQQYDCAFFSSNEERSTPESADDGCMNDEGWKSWPMTITLGARFVPPVRGLSALLAVDLGVGGTDRFVRELVPNAPFRVLIGVGYDYDAEPPPPPPAAPEPVVAPVEEEPEPVVGRIQGVVTALGSGVPVAGAQVAFPDKGVTALSTGDSGRFVSYEFKPGTVVMNVSHPDYEPGQCTATIPEAGGDTEVRCELTPLPQDAALEGRVVDAWGMGVAGARVQISGPASATLITDEQGKFSRSGLPAGSYSVRVDSSSHMIRSTSVTVGPRGTTTVSITSPARPAKPTVEIRGDAIRTSDLTFANDSTDLSNGGPQALAELADLLLRNPSLRIRLQAPGSPSLALTRSLLLKQELANAGVDESRIEAVGGGGKKLSIAIVGR